MIGPLISLAPAAGELGHLLRLAVDAEQVGATRIHLAADQGDFVALVAGLRRHTDLVITTDPAHDTDLVDRLPPDFTEIMLAGDDPIALTAEVARVAAEQQGELSLGGRGAAAGPVLFAAIAVGADLLVGTALSGTALSGTAMPGTAPSGTGPSGTRPSGTGPSGKGTTLWATATTDRRNGDRPAPGRDDVALVARAAGLARIAGRPALAGRAARARWRIG